MAEQQETPIYWDQHATKWNLTLIFSLVVLVMGFFMGYLLVALGAVMGGYSWLTTPRQFLLYRDSMVIVYGMPRTRVVSFAEISHVELLALPFGERLRIRMISGSRMMLMMRDPGAFRVHLEDALARYHGEQSGVAYATGTLVDRQTDPEFAVDDADDDSYDDSVTEYEAKTEITDHAEFDGELETDADTADTTGTHTEKAPEPSQEEVYTSRVEQAASVSGSYTESAEPDFSGEGSPMFGAEVEFETTSDEDDESSPRPPSPY